MKLYFFYDIPNSSAFAWVLTISDLIFWTNLIKGKQLVLFKVQVLYFRFLIFPLTKIKCSSSDLSWIFVYTGAGGNEVKVTQYLVLFDNILHRLRFPKFLEIVSEELDKNVSSFSFYFFYFYVLMFDFGLM